MSNDVAARFAALCSNLGLTVVDADDFVARDNSDQIWDLENQIADPDTDPEDLPGLREELEDAIATTIEADRVCDGPYGYGDTFEINGEEWAVLADYEAAAAFLESIESYVDDCLDIPDNIRSYFDVDAFARDVELTDGRGPSLAAWDGAEEYADGFFLYRQN